MVSAIDRAKRALVVLLKHLARVYGVTVGALPLEAEVPLGCVTSGRSAQMIASG